MQNQYQQLYDRVLVDSGFRRMLASNPEEALRTIGIEPTEQILHAIKSIKRDVEKLEDIFGDGGEAFAP
jgi:hypothetical protein